MLMFAARLWLESLLGASAFLETTQMDNALVTGYFYPISVAKKILQITPK